jgi:hypothetical protein
VTVVVLSRDLLIASRILSQAEAARREARMVVQPADLPSADEVDLLFVNWTDRDADWGARLHDWCAGAPASQQPRIILFGPHTDLEAHAAARDAGLGPMVARSKLIADLPIIMARSRGRSRA